MNPISLRAASRKDGFFEEDVLEIARLVQEAGALREEPDVVGEAPHTAAIRRPDETEAARRPALRWSPSV